MATEQGHATEHSHTTTDHEEIRRWAEERGGRPASVKGTEHGREKAGILRINFPGSEADEALYYSCGFTVGDRSAAQRGA